MKILKMGQLPGEKTYQTTCSHCQTEFEFTEAEATRKTDRNDICLVVMCPVCKRDRWKKIN